MEKPQPEWGIKLSKYCFIPQRVIVSIMGFFVIVNSYTTRVCITLVITQLVKPLNHTVAELEAELACPIDPDNPPDSEASHGGIYEWSQDFQGFIISCFYIGYVIIHIPCGMWAEQYGARYVLLIGMFFSSVLTMVQPLCLEYWGIWAMIACRMLLGLSQGGSYPAVSTLLSKWVPIRERSVLGGLVMSGGQFGSVMSNSMSGWLLANWPWQVVFYVFGFINLLWCIFFFLMCWSYPATHPYVKPSEREYILQEIGQLRRDKTLLIPWKAILTSVPIYAMLIGQLGHDWGVLVMAHDLQKYMHDVMQFSIMANGLYSSLPFLMTSISTVVSGFISDYLIRKKLVTIKNIRRINTFVSGFFPGLFMVLASYAGCNKIAVVACFTIAMTFMGIFFTGLKLTPLDMSPNFSGILMALSNGVSSNMGTLAPYIAGVMTPNTSLMEWRAVFWVTFAILTGTAIIFWIWGDSDIQTWNEGRKPKDAKTTE